MWCPERTNKHLLHPPYRYPQPPGPVRLVAYQVSGVCVVCVCSCGPVSVSSIGIDKSEFIVVLADTRWCQSEEVPTH